MAELAQTTFRLFAVKDDKNEIVKADGGQCYWSERDAEAWCAHWNRAFRPIYKVIRVTVTLTEDCDIEGGQ